MILEQVDQGELAFLARQHRPRVLIDKQVFDLLMLYDFAEQIVDRLSNFDQIAGRLDCDKADAVAVLVGDADSWFVYGTRERLG